MSRRRGLRFAGQAEVAASDCACGVPTRDGAFVCDGCLDVLAANLRSLLPGRDPRRTLLVEFGAWCPYPAQRIGEPTEGLWQVLLSTVAGEQGTDYRKVGGSSGGSDETGLELNTRASRAARDLERALTRLVLECTAARVVSVAPVREPRTGRGARSRDRMVPDMAVWLSWRVDGMAWHPTVAAQVHEVNRCVEAAVWVVDRPATRQQLGDCPVAGCAGALSASPGAVHAYCSTERHAVEAQPLRDRLTRALDDRLVTAAEFARLSTYLGVDADRGRVAARVRQWAHRGQVAAHDPSTDPSTDPDADADAEAGARYRFGDLYRLLVAGELARESRRAVKAAP